MPEKEGAEEKSTKSVVNKKQKQMMGEEGYDHLRDMGRIRKNKDKKDATTMPPSKEMEKTRKVNKGPSALELVKKKYKGQIMDMKTEEAKSLFSTPGLDKLKKLKDFKKNADRVFGRKSPDLTKVAESFGGHIISEQEFSDKQRSDMKKLLNKNFGSKEKSKEAAGKLIKDTAKKDVEKVQSGRTVKKKINPNVSKGSGDGVTGRKGEKIVKSIPMSKSEADKISKKLGSDRPDSPKTAAKEAQRRFRMENPRASGDFSPTMPTQLRKVRQAKRDARAKKLGTPDPFTTPTPKKPIRPFGDKPVAGGMKFPQRVATSTGRDGVTKMYREPVGPGGSTLPIKPKRERIPADTGSLKDAPKVKKRFSQLSKDIKDLKVDRDIEKRVANPKTASTVVSTTKSKGRGAVSKGADFSGVSRKTGAMKSGPKVVKQLGRTPKLGGSVVKVVGKETKKAAAKTAAKQVTKTAGKKALQKGIAKGVAKQIPGIGSLISGAEAGVRALRGDFKGAALSAGEAIPGVGLGFAAANIARDVSKAKKAASAVKTITKAKRAKDAVKVVTPTVVGSTADKLAVVKKKVGQFAKTPTGAATVIGGGALTGKGIEKNIDPRKLRPPTVKGGRAGRRSAKS
jgi:hypothetical protein